MVEALAPKPASILCDCTLGGAGHTLALAEKLGPQGAIIGIDQDEHAITAAQERVKKYAPAAHYRFFQGNFAELNDILLQAQLPFVDGFLFDLGVSSYQFDAGERGFSYRFDAPLDMRMDSGKHTLNAAEVINTYNEADLARIFFAYGEEPHAKAIAHDIVAQRRNAPYRTTFDLVKTIQRHYPHTTKSRKHPAKRVFQALRIEVNHELQVLKEALTSAIAWLAPQGRIAVISYHSLEDKLVKHTFYQYSKGCTCPPDLPVCVCNHVPILKLITAKPLRPSEAEIKTNPRARSALLRVAEKV